MEKNALCQEIAPNVDRGTGTGIKVRNGLIEHSSGMWIPLKKSQTIDSTISCLAFYLFTFAIIPHYFSNVLVIIYNQYSHVEHIQLESDNLSDYRWILIKIENTYHHNVCNMIAK